MQKKRISLSNKRKKKETIKKEKRINQINVFMKKRRT